MRHERVYRNGDEAPFIFNVDTGCGDRSTRDGGRVPSLMSQTVVLAIFMEAIPL